MPPLPAAAAPPSDPPAARPPSFQYRARFRSRAWMAGAHPGVPTGAGLEVAASLPWHRARTLRRLDVRASLRDPWGDWWVREHHARARLNVWLLADLSASMRGPGPGDRAAGWHDVAAALQRSVQQHGDAYGQLGFDARLCAPVTLRPSASVAAQRAALQALFAQPLTGDGAGAMVHAAAAVVGPPALVFLLSDFQLPLTTVQTALAALVRHDVVPVWLTDPSAPDGLPDHGLLPLWQAEGGQSRLLWLRLRLHGGFEADRVQALFVDRSGLAAEVELRGWHERL